MKCRKARQAAMAAAAQHMGQRQISQARMMQSNASFIAPATPSAQRPPCSSLQEARTRCLQELGNFLVEQHSMQLAEQYSGPQARHHSMLQQRLQQGGSGEQDHKLSSLRPAPSTPAALQRTLAPIPAEGVVVLDDTAAAADADAAEHSVHHAQYGTVSATALGGAGGGAGGRAGGKSGGEVLTASASRSAAATAALASRQLPSMFKQLQLVMLRCFWKAVLSRSALSTDLILTSLLGVALGVAQGRNIVPGGSLMWMLITLLAYGSITLVRSTRSYGSERHIYLQQESPVSSTAGRGLLVGCVCLCVEGVLWLGCVQVHHKGQAVTPCYC